MKPFLSFSASLRLCASLLLAASLQGQTPSVKINATNGALFAPGFTATQILASNGVVTNGALTAVSNSLQGQITTNTSAITAVGNSLTNYVQTNGGSGSILLLSGSTYEGGTIVTNGGSPTLFLSASSTISGSGTLSSLTVTNNFFANNGASVTGVLNVSGSGVFGGASFFNNSVTLGAASGNTLTVNAGTLTASNATSLASNNIANVGSLRNLFLTNADTNGAAAVVSNAVNASLTAASNTLAAGITSNATAITAVSNNFVWATNGGFPSNAYVGNNLTVTNNLTVNGNTTLGDAAGDTVTVNAGTFIAANATNLGSTDFANIGSLDTRYFPAAPGPSGDIYTGAQSVAATNASVGYSNYPVTLTGTNSNAVATGTNLPFSNGMSITISSANHAEYNGEFIITNATTNSFSYTTASVITATNDGSSTVTAANQWVLLFAGTGEPIGHVVGVVGYMGSRSSFSVDAVGSVYSAAWLRNQATEGAYNISHIRASMTASSWRLEVRLTSTPVCIAAAYIPYGATGVTPYATANSPGPYPDTSVRVSLLNPNLVGNFMVTPPALSAGASGTVSVPVGMQQPAPAATSFPYDLANVGASFSGSLPTGYIFQGSYQSGSSVVLQFYNATASTITPSAILTSISVQQKNN